MNIKSDLQEKLEALAYKRTYPFCYSCYNRAPSGKCDRCESDDLMRELPGEEVEYGVEWVIESLVRNNLEAADISSSFEESLEDCYPETTKIGWLEYDTTRAIKELDPVSFEMAKQEYVDSEIENEILMTFDNGGSYYLVHDLEDFLDNSESQV